MIQSLSPKTPKPQNPYSIIMEATPKLFIASDHAAFAMKETIKAYLTSKGRSFVDVGCDSPDRVDYPVYAKLLAEKVAEDPVNN